MQRYNFFANNMGEYPFFCVLEHEITKTKKKSEIFLEYVVFLLTLETKAYGCPVSIT